MESDTCADLGAHEVVSTQLSLATSTDLDDWEADLPSPKQQVIIGDARDIDLPDSSVDLVVTSPPYWRKRDYDHDSQIGQEPAPAD